MALWRTLRKQECARVCGWRGGVLGVRATSFDGFYMQGPMLCLLLFGGPRGAGAAGGGGAAEPKLKLKFSPEGQLVGRLARAREDDPLRRGRAESGGAKHRRRAAAGATGGGVCGSFLSSSGKNSWHQHQHENIFQSTSSCTFGPSIQVPNQYAVRFW